jgi:hypothetical protein
MTFPGAQATRKNVTYRINYSPCLPPRLRPDLYDIQKWSALGALRPVLSVDPRREAAGDKLDRVFPLQPPQYFGLLAAAIRTPWCSGVVDAMTSLKRRSADAWVDIALEIKDLQPQYDDVPYAFVDSPIVMSKQDAEERLRGTKQLFLGQTAPKVHTW